MDASKYMIVDLQQQDGRSPFITERVASIRKEGGFYWITFSGGRQPWKYRCERIFYQQNPEIVDIGDRGFYVKKKRITDCERVLRFADGYKTFWHIIYKNGYQENLYDRDVHLSRTDISAENVGLWNFLNHIVSETGLQIHADKDELLNILQLQYNLVDVKRDNTPLALYLKGKSSGASKWMPNHVFYPFGCNGSQKKAVENALSHQVSIIQGPPGTGKTQTILNIISNLLLNGKTILVVSNNNSAVDNVAEKLSSDEVGLGFIVAKLGSVENRTRFIENQTKYPDMAEWKLDNEAEVREKVDEKLKIASEGFDKQTRLAQLRAEYAALLTEQKYDDLQRTSDSFDTSWLETKLSGRLMKLLLQLQRASDAGTDISLFSRIKWCFSLGMRAWGILKSPHAVPILEAAYYRSRKAEIETEMAECENFLKTHNIKECVDELRHNSLDYLKSRIAVRYKGNNRAIFERETIKQKSEQFLNEYPVVLSTTYSAKSCISKNLVFDYVIMDEASQVDIVTGALALSCAENAVIVGDDKQLPNVIDGKTLQVMEDLEDTYSVAEEYRISQNSFLSSCNRVFKDAPSTLLREHYRCHPKIIEFCNKMFYDGELVTMTIDDDEQDVLHVFLTPKGNHASGHVNQREIDVIEKEVIPTLKGEKSVGIISPYRDQTETINKQFHKDVASTVHKYQGRECNAIIMSMVDNQPTSFSDDANLLNVAISRAKSKLCIVASGNEIPQDSLLAQLIGYVRYNNFDVTESKLHSVFDILYGQYTQERLKFERENALPSDELSENIIYSTLQNALKQMGQDGKIHILAHYPLVRLITDTDLLSDDEKEFVESPFSHIDFLLYNIITKQPLLCVEVDGWKYHSTEVQRHRDTLKDGILAKYGLPIKRLSTNSVVNAEMLVNTIKGLRSVSHA